MYLKTLELINFRKFGTKYNIVEFVDAESFEKHKSGNKVSIAPVTTLIVGKNNSGKTTVVTALEKVLSKNFLANDFNFSYLSNKLTEYEKESPQSNPSFTPPYLEFKITIGIEKNSDDLITNLAPFMTLGDIEDADIDIIIRHEHSEEQVFRENITELLDSGFVDRRLRFKKFIEIINSSTDFKTKYYHKNNLNSPVPFNLKDLVELVSIKANNIEGEHCLSKSFSKIVKYRYESLLDKEDRKKLESKIDEINENVNENLATEHTQSINESLKEIESPEKLEMLLSSNLTFERLMSILDYEYVENKQSIPENQFGLGYTNLMKIVADLIDYMEKYPDQSFNSKINLISIEEPETFMHPQMQELFIKNIDEAISALLGIKRKNINSQLIVTTHSSHILNSKIHSGNTFNNINYITTVDNFSHVVALNDDKISSESINDEQVAEETQGTDDANVTLNPTIKNIKKENDFKFLKKHIKYKVSELFFSDAVVFVEGITEETLLRYHIDDDSSLNKYYISIFNIGGAHGHIYHNLLRLLKVPTLIITDLDIKRDKDEQENFIQINTIKNRTTTNATIKKYQNGKNILKELSDFIQKDNIRITYQGKIEEYFATSFEEAYILTNYNNSILKEVLKILKPDIVKGIIGKGTNEDVSKLKGNSYKLQRKLSGSKSDFANELLYRLIAEEDLAKHPVLPQYISDNLSWLSLQLNPNTK